MSINLKLEHPAEYVATNLLLDAAQRFTELDKDLCKQMGKLCVPALIRFSKDSLFALEAVNLDDEELKWMSRRELLKKIFTILYNCIRYILVFCTLFKMGPWSWVALSKSITEFVIKFSSVPSHDFSYFVKENPVRRTSNKTPHISSMITISIAQCVSQCL